jgi:hypothetical protein
MQNEQIALIPWQLAAKAALRRLQAKCCRNCRTRLDNSACRWHHGLTSLEPAKP